MPNPLPLVFDAPRRAMPPRHFADLDESGRAAAVAELGLPAFRAKQLANQYYGRLIADP
ncbi:MAG: 23S rRNA (adenine(2503)-C(2))-methyltransferase RlmN, partial [Mycolicibacterium vanbaalenii]